MQPAKWTFVDLDKCSTMLKIKIDIQYLISTAGFLSIYNIKSPGERCYSFTDKVKKKVFMKWLACKNIKSNSPKDIT